jgi:hypothetical protein
MPLCVHVTLIPDKINKKVLYKGMPKGFITIMPSGGKYPPKILSTFVPLWKKAQKKPKNSIISDTINKINPLFRPFCTTAQ